MTDNTKPMDSDQTKALQLATEAGHILLENGAEIGRVEKTMEHIASAYGIDDESFFVLSNGIFATGNHYARAEFIPIKGSRLDKVVGVNQVSRDVIDSARNGKPLPLDEVSSRLEAVRTLKNKPWWELVAGIAVGVSSFCILFGGSFVDASITLACGLLMGVYITFISPTMSRIFSNLLGGMLGGLLCIVGLLTIPLHLHLPNMIIGTIIALVPGVPFTNGIRDLANEDYLAGLTRLMDAFLSFLCIAIGVTLAFIIEGFFSDGIMQLGTPVVNPATSAWYIQLIAAFAGTVGFSILFGVPRRYYIYGGLVGMLGWLVFLLAGGFTDSVPRAAFFGALMVATVSAVLAVKCHCPSTVFLICGIIPLVPGGGIFWTAYYLVTNQLRIAATTGFVAIKVTIAIAGAIILGAVLTSRFYRHKTKKQNGSD